MDTQLPIGVLALDMEEGIAWAENAGLKDYIVYTDDTKFDFLGVAIRTEAVTAGYYAKVVRQVLNAFRNE